MSNAFERLGVIESRLPPYVIDLASSLQTVFTKYRQKPLNPQHVQAVAALSMERGFVTVRSKFDDILRSTTEEEALVQINALAKYLNEIRARIPLNSNGSVQKNYKNISNEVGDYQKLVDSFLQARTMVDELTV